MTENANVYASVVVVDPDDPSTLVLTPVLPDPRSSGGWLDGLSECVRRQCAVVVHERFTRVEDNGGLVTIDERGLSIQHGDNEHAPLVLTAAMLQEMSWISLTRMVHGWARSHHPETHLLCALSVEDLAEAS